MTTFLLIRHGETDAVGRSIMGWAPGWHLNETGRRQAERLATRLAGLPIQAILARWNGPLKPHRPLPSSMNWSRSPTPTSGNSTPAAGRESRSPTWTSATTRRRFNTVRSLTRAPGGEIAVETQARMVRKIHELAGRHDGGTVAIVSHGDPLRAAIAYFLGMPLDFLLRFEVHPASLSVVELGEWGVEVLCVNDRGGEVHWKERS